MNDEPLKSIMPDPSPGGAPSVPDLPEWVRLVIRQVSQLQYGTIQITIHGGKVTQVEATEKIRLGQ